MKILLTGRNGQVGLELDSLLTPLGRIDARDRTTLDIFYPDLIRAAVRQAKPDVIVNAAAYTAVDRAESDADTAMEVNAVAPGVLAEEAKRLGALIVHFSTDYIFDGRKRAPYVEDDVANPLSVYGRTKLEGEKAIRATGARHLIVRTAWVYGQGRNFVSAILAKAAAGEALRVVSDQRGAPTWSRDLARATAELIGTGAEGTFHVSAEGDTSWHAVAQEALRQKGLPTLVEPVASSAYPAAAKRPAYSVLDNSKLTAAGIARIGPWRERLAAMLAAPAATEAKAK